METSKMQVVTNMGECCPHCGMFHSTTWPRIKAIEYENGLIKRIEFHQQGHAGYGQAQPQQPQPQRFVTYGPDH